MKPSVTAQRPAERENLAALWILVVLLLLGIHAGMVMGGVTPLLQGGMPDSDTYMRLVRVDALAHGQSWFDSTVARMNAPYGDVLNWTRPLDVLILAGAWGLHHLAHFSGPEALFWSGAMLPVLLHVLLGVAVVWAFAPLIPRATGPLLFLIVTLQPVMLAYNMAGRPDHQTLLIICAAMMMGHVVREQAGLSPRLRSGIEAGLWAGLGLWVSVEFQFVLLVLFPVFGLLWLVTGEDRQLRAAEGVSLGLLVMTGLAVLAERGAQWADIRELDKISLSHFLAAAVNCGVWGITAGMGRDRTGWVGRLGVLTLSGFLGVVALLFFAPEILRGPAGDVDPRILRDFLLSTREMRPLIPVDGTTWLWLGTPLVALPLWAGLQSRLPRLWIPLFALVGAFTAFGLLHARFAQFAAPFGAVLLVEAFRLMTEPASKAKGFALPEVRFSWRRVVIACVVLAGPVLLGLVLIGRDNPSDTDSARRQQACAVSRITPTLSALPPGIIMAPLNYGPELLYRTPHSVVAGPYHRNRDGIRDSLDFFETGDQRLLTRRGVAYVLVCEGDRGTFARRLMGEGPLPKGLVPIPLPALSPSSSAPPSGASGSASGFRLFRVTPSFAHSPHPPEKGVGSRP